MRRSTVASKHALYIEVERARTALRDAVFRFDLYRVEVDEFWFEGTSERLQKLAAAVDGLSRACSGASLYGSTQTSNACFDAWYQSMLVAHAADSHLQEQTAANRSAVTQQAEHARDACDRLLVVMRRELGSMDYMSGTAPAREPIRAFARWVRQLRAVARVARPAARQEDSGR